MSDLVRIPWDGSGEKLRGGLTIEQHPTVLDYKLRRESKEPKRTQPLSLLDPTLAYFIELKQHFDDQCFMNLSKKVTGLHFFSITNKFVKIFECVIIFLKFHLQIEF